MGFSAASKSRDLSLQRYRLHQITRAIDVQAFSHRHVIGEKLQRHDFQNRRQQLRRGGNKNSVIGELAHLLITFGGNRDHSRGLPFEAFDIGNVLLITQH